MFYMLLLICKMDEYRRDCIKNTIEKSKINEDLYNLIVKLDNNSEFYLDQEKMKEELHNMMITVLERNSHSNKNRCVECGEDMGINNPRQLCGKTYCRNLRSERCNNCSNVLQNNEVMTCNRLECIRDRCHC